MTTLANGGLTTADAEAMLREWGEPLVYSPLSGPQRNIIGIVDRDPPQPLPGVPEQAMAQHLRVTVANRATAFETDTFGGISTAEVDRGGDKIQVPVQIGVTARWLTVRQVLNQDGAMMTLEVS